jgi:hypothetical protein
LGSEAVQQEVDDLGHRELPLGEKLGFARVVVPLVVGDLREALLYSFIQRADA